MRVPVLISCLLPGFLTGVPASAQTTSVTEAPTVVDIEAEDLFRARRVLQRFFARERHPECYRVLFTRVDGNLNVEFVPWGDRVVVVREGERPPPVRRRCGRNVGYVLDRNGNVIRRIYSR